MVLVFLGAAWTLLGLCQGFGWAILEGAGPHNDMRAGHAVLAKFVLVCCGNEASWKGLCPPEITGAQHTVSRLG